MSEIAGQAQERAGQAAQQARTQAVQGAGQALGRLRVGVDQQSVVLGERVNTTAQRARLIGAELRRMGENTPARFAEQTATRGQQLGDWLKQLDADELTGYARRIQPGRAVSGVEGFARRRPLLALATGAAIGFLPARLIKMSSGRRQAASSPALEAEQPAPVTPEVGSGGFADTTTMGGGTIGSVESTPLVDETTVVRTERISPAPTDIDDDFRTGR